MALDKSIAANFRYLAVFTLGSILWAQINTESMRKGDFLTGLHPAINLDVGIVAGNSKLLSINSTLRFDYLKGEGHTYLTSSRQLDQTDSLIINKGFVHLRRTQSLRGNIFVEVFVQQEFDQFIHLKDRILAGGGLRLLLVEVNANKKEPPILKLYSGLGFMWEQERISNPKDPDDSLKNLLRSTNYLVLKWEPDDRLLIQATTYFQSDVRHVSDFRMLFDGGLSFTLTGKLTAVIKFYARYDHDPPAGLNLKKYDIELTNGLAYTF